MVTETADSIAHAQSLKCQCHLHRSKVNVQIQRTLETEINKMNIYTCILPTYPVQIMNEIRTEFIHCLQIHCQLERGREYSSNTLKFRYTWHSNGGWIQAWLVRQLNSGFKLGAILQPG